MPIFRVRRTSGAKGHSNYAYHADIIARDKKAALAAAQEGRVYNWRWIDTFDVAPEDYEEFEILGEGEPEKACRPMTVKLQNTIRRLEKKIWAMPGIISLGIGTHDGVVVYQKRIKGLRENIRYLVGKQLPECRIRFYYEPV